MMDGQTCMDEMIADPKREVPFTADTFQTGNKELIRIWKENNSQASSKSVRVHEVRRKRFTPCPETQKLSFCAVIAELFVFFFYILIKGIAIFLKIFLFFVLILTVGCIMCAGKSYGGLK